MTKNNVTLKDCITTKGMEDLGVQLIESGADWNEIDYSGNSMLKLAVWYNKTEIVEAIARISKETGKYVDLDDLSDSMFFGDNNLRKLFSDVKDGIAKRLHNNNKLCSVCVALYVNEKPNINIGDVNILSKLCQKAHSELMR